MLLYVPGFVAARNSVLRYFAETKEARCKKLFDWAPEKVGFF